MSGMGRKQTERGRRNPTITIVERLATALGVDVVELLRPN